MVKRAKPAGWHGGSRQSLPRTGQEPETAEHKILRDHTQPERRPRLHIEVRYTRGTRASRCRRASTPFGKSSTRPKTTFDGDAE
jgi:hypothetical protein